MCGEWAGSNLGQPVSPEFHVAQFAASVADLLSEKGIYWLRIYQEGSFLNDSEVSPQAREVILRLASNLRGIGRITIESRPEYVAPGTALAVRRQVRPPVELSIGIGLESQDDYVRNVCIGKGTSLSSYERAVEVAHASDILTLAYVLLKPPFLSEREAIDDAIESVAYAFRIGFDEVYVQAASIHGWSLSEVLAVNGLYSAPWLWSVLEVTKATAKLGDVKIGGLEYFPRPSIVAQNYQDVDNQTTCGCSESVWHLIEEYNATGDVALFRDATCSCREIWQRQLESREEAPLPLRISQMLSEISVEDYLRLRRGASLLPDRIAAPVDCLGLPIPERNGVQ